MSTSTLALLGILSSIIGGVVVKLMDHLWAMRLEKREVTQSVASQMIAEAQSIREENNHIKEELRQELRECRQRCDELSDKRQEALHKYNNCEQERLLLADELRRATNSREE